RFTSAAVLGPAVTRNRPSGLNSASLTVPPWTMYLRTVLPVETSQIRASRSVPAVTSFEPSAEKATEVTAPRCPSRRTSDLPARARHSAPAEEDDAIHRAVVARQDGEARAGVGLPEPHGVVGARSRLRVTIWCERHIGEVAAVTNGDRGRGAAADEPPRAGCAV